MNALEKIIRNVRAAQNLTNIFSQVLNENSEIGNFVINKITNRLYNSGKTASGIKLKTDSAKPNKSYSDTTIFIKAEQNKEFRHVTLNDTDYFYNSFEVEFIKDTIKISADFIKGNTDIADNFTFQFSKDEFHKEILDLSKSERKEVGKLILPYLISKIVKILIYGR